MLRRAIASAFVLCLSASALAAAERATFILTDGERISGTLAFHTDTGELLIDNDFSLAVTPGQPERIFHYQQVAVIDFIGGTPKTAELAALPDQGHTLVMRNGDIKQGHFVNIIGGETVKWQDTVGPTRSIPVTDVARIYLNPDSARNTFNYTKPAATASAPTPGAPAAKPGPASADPHAVSATIPVPANTQWVDTGLDVTKGELLRFDASGQIAFRRGADGTTGPDGDRRFKSGKYPMSSSPVGTLIGRVGGNRPFVIGSNRNPFQMPASGRLLLGVNDDDTSDNSGAFQVTINRGR